MFFGSHRHVFRSRWRALVWSVGICLTAYCVVPSADQGADGGTLIEMGKAAAGQVGKQADAGEHHNPWALRPEE